METKTYITDGKVKFINIIAYKSDKLDIYSIISEMKLKNWDLSN